MARRDTGTRLDPEFKVSPGIKKWVRDKFPVMTDQQLQDCRDSFVDYWVGVPGKAGYKLDWDATFRNQVRFYVTRNKIYTKQETPTMMSVTVDIKCIYCQARIKDMQLPECPFHKGGQ